MPAHVRPFVSRLPWLAEVLSTAYIALIALLAQITGLVYVLFPELGALAHDILKRPHGTWAQAPFMLIVTPLLAAVAGTLIARHLPYGFMSVLLAVGSAMSIIAVLKSPIAPAISAGLLPLTLGVTSWAYPMSLLIGTGILAGVAIVWRKLHGAPSTTAISMEDLADDIVEESPTGYTWVPFFAVFLAITLALSCVNGWRLVLFPPLVVIGFEMFAHASICPWARRPLALPIACAVTATAGVFFVSFLGVGPFAAAASVLVGVGILRILDLHVPPALAVGLLPSVMPTANYYFPIAVATGTLLLTTSFVVWRRLALRRWAAPE
ncbi:MAG: HPP family protein [Proteobacteria bacterium]|nr:HPP family protein [Pseudomonadota bacterium]